MDTVLRMLLPVVWFSCLPLQAQWLQFGGPNRDFTSSETGLLDKWPETGLKPLWETHLNGNYASILVDGDAIYSMFKGAENEEMVASLNARDGRIRWQKAFVVPEPPEKTMLNFGRGPNTTPLIQGDRILAASFLGRLWCLNKHTGELLWSLDLVEELGAKYHTFGYSISPLTYGNTVLVATGGPHGMVALSWADGSVLWKSATIDVSYAAPILIRIDGQEQVVLVASTEVVGLSPTDGRIYWRYPHANVNKNNCAQPLWGDDQRLFLSSHDDGGARVLQLSRAEGKTRVTELWHRPEIKFFHTASIRAGDYVYGSSGTWPPTFLMAIHLPTGKIHWRARGYNKANLLRADDKMIVLDEDGKLTLARMNQEQMTVISSFQPLEKTAWAPPTLTDGILYIRDQSKVMAFDLRRRP